MNPRLLLLPVLLTTLGGCNLPDIAGLSYEPEPHDAERRMIGEVQGSDVESPLLGQDVAIEGTVVRATLGDEDNFAAEVAIAAAGRLPPKHGWFVQDEGDGDPATSDGIFVADDGFDTFLGMPGEAEYTMRMGTPVRSGDRIKVRGVVVELAADQATDTPRAGGHRVSRGAPGGTLTTVVAQSIVILLPEDRPELPALSVAAEPDAEPSEGMRLAD
jgi:hypothetical protein